MLKITVELIPFGDESQKKVIGTAVIANVNPGTESDYMGWVSKDNFAMVPAKFSKVFKWDRSQSVWLLIKEILSNLGSTPSTDDNSVDQRLKRRL